MAVERFEAVQNALLLIHDESVSLDVKGADRDAPIREVGDDLKQIVSIEVQIDDGEKGGGLVGQALQQAEDG